MSDRVLVTGAGGFIGGWLAGELVRRGHAVRAVDIKPEGAWFQRHAAAETMVADLREPAAARAACRDAAVVYNLASDMGGMGFIESHKADCMLSVLINGNLLAAAREAGVERYFFASSACVYRGAAQASAGTSGLREADAYPADPEDGYGWEKLFSERLCRHFREDYGLATRIARYHNVYGPWGAYAGGREKAPAAICRKVIEAGRSGSGEIEVWGDGEQTRSFTYIDDALTGTLAITASGIEEPLNLGSSETVTINRLVDLVEEIAGVRLRRRYNLAAPMGVRGRSSDNRLIRQLLDWEPSTPLREGLERTYAWVHDRMAED